MYLVGLHTASDDAVWQYARDHGFMIVTQDSDYHERSLLRGYPPKIIWIRTGNTSTQNLIHLLTEHRDDIFSFAQDESLGCLEIY